MKISSLSFPKYRHSRKTGDDTSLILPGLLAVFDGASSETVNASGESPGKAASVAAANAIAAMVLNAQFFDASAEEICDQVQQHIALLRGRFSDEGNPVTTMAAVGFDGGMARIFVVGDSGVRINGTQVFRHLKRVDDVWTNARVHVFRILSGKHDDLDLVETLSRRCTFSGLHYAESQKILTADEIDQVLTETLKLVPVDGAEMLLRYGIKKQHEFANDADHPLGYSLLNDRKTSMTDVIDVSMKLDEITSAEIFSDGYFSIPTGTSIEDWENEFDAVEHSDPNKVGEFSSVKGSTATEFSDDRTVIAAAF